MNDSLKLKMQQYFNSMKSEGVAAINTSDNKIEAHFESSERFEQSISGILSNVNLIDLVSNLSALNKSAGNPELLSIKIKGEHHFIKWDGKDRIIYSEIKSDNINYLKIKSAITAVVD